MKIRLPLFLSLLIVAAMAGISAWAWQLIPDTARIAVHFDAHGVPNGFAGKTFALSLMPAMALGLTVLLSVVPSIEPRRFNLAASAMLYKTAWIGGLVLLAIGHTAIVLSALHVNVDVPRLIIPGVAVLFLIVGNFLGKTRPNFSAGIRTRWTLSSDYSWEKTHRLTGRLFVLAAAAGLVVSLVADQGIACLILVGGAFAAWLIGVIASYFYWRRDPARHSSDSVPE